MFQFLQDLPQELESELAGDFEELILALMMTPTEYDTYCLHDAMDGLGTREAALIGILTTRNATVSIFMGYSCYGNKIVFCKLICL